MFILAVLAALAVTASADIPNCATKSLGVSTTKYVTSFPLMEDGHCNARIDLSNVEGCNNQGVFISLCDDDSRPLITIANSLQYIDIKREGHCRDDIQAMVTVYCEEAAQGRQGSYGRSRMG